MTELTEAEREALRGAFDDGGAVVWLALQNAVSRIVAARETAARVEALREAADEVHTEAWWTHERTMRGAPPDPLDRLMVVERVIRDHADRIEREGR
ncbi:MAG: hypothetical protein CMH83_19515 [Nocardioides sp.]|nr:hypothetical protein [Nocardioides sp.]